MVQEWLPRGALADVSEDSSAYEQEGLPREAPVDAWEWLLRMSGENSPTYALEGISLGALVHARESLPCMAWDDSPAYV